jgi:hypothetical protein
MLTNVSLVQKDNDSIFSLIREDRYKTQMYTHVQTFYLHNHLCNNETV